MNHRGEVFKQSKPTIPEQIHHINPPRSFAPMKQTGGLLTPKGRKPESFNIATDDEVMPQAKAKPRSAGGSKEPLPQTKPKAKASASSSSSQALPIVEVMDASAEASRGFRDVSS